MKLFQLMFALIDKMVSEMFALQSWGTGNEAGENRWTYFVDFGRLIGIVGTDGKIHTLMSYWSVHHYYDGKKLLRRILVRRDLKQGERLATPEEVRHHQDELRERYGTHLCGGLEN